MKKIDFLIAGVQKGGTTALYNYLKMNPHIYMPATKEIHFFDNESVDWANPVYDTYQSNFSAAQAGQLLGEATPIYTFWENSLERIAIYNKNMKLIICLRDPTERAYSSWSMVTSMRREDIPFSQAIREGRTRIEDELSKRRFTYVERGFYATQIKQALKYFDTINLHIIQQADLLNNHNSVLEGICDFLNIPHMELDHEFVRPVKNDDDLPKMSKIDREYLDNLYADDQLETRSLVDHINNCKSAN